MNKYDVKNINRRNFLKAVGLGAVAVGGVGCDSPLERDAELIGAKADEVKPNLLFVFSDQQRKHAVGFMGEDPVITPNADKLAEEGCAFMNCVSNNPICSPMRASLFTGKYSKTTGFLMNNDRFVGKHTFWGQSLQQAGYHTGYVGKWHLGLAPKHRPDKIGFELWQAYNFTDNHWKCQYEGTEGRVDKYGWQVTHEVDVALDYLENKFDKDRPFALFVSHHPPHSINPRYWDPKDREYDPELSENMDMHKPIQGENWKLDKQYLAPTEYMDVYENRDMKRRPNVPPNANPGGGGFAVEACPGYFGGVNSVDHEFGRLLKALEKDDPRNPGKKLKDTTVVVFTSDHGEMLGSHERMMKGLWYEEASSVPFIIRWPDHIAANKKVETVFSTIDIMPTMLGLMDLEIPQDVDGENLSALMTDAKYDPKGKTAYMHFYSGWWDKPEKGPEDLYWRAIRTDRYTYVVGTGEDRMDKKILKMFEKDPGKLGAVGSIARIETKVLAVKKQSHIHWFYDNQNDPYQMNPIVYGQSDKTDRIMERLHKKFISYLEKTDDAWLKVEAVTKLKSVFS